MAIPVLAVITIAGIAAYASYKWATQPSVATAAHVIANPSPSQNPTRPPPVPRKKHVPQDKRPALFGEECVICRGEPSFFPKQPPTTSCRHLSEVCSDCLKRTIESAVTDGGLVPSTPTTPAGSSTSGSSRLSEITGVRCPSVGCTEVMGHSEIQRWAEASVFQKYDKEVLKRSLASNELYVVCVNSSCDAGQLHTGSDDNPVVICYACGTKQCFRHRVEWHHGISCKQWDKKSVRDKRYDNLTYEWIKSGTRPCPNCRRRIQKNNGCDHMTCKPPGGCGHQFCWLCLASWHLIRQYDNSYHYDHCKYYSGKTGGNPAPANNETRKKMAGWKFWKRR